jgi:hypothetical protein
MAAPTPMDNKWARTAPAIRYVKFANYSDLSHYPMIVQANNWNNYASVNSVPIRFQALSSCGSNTPCFNITESSACTSGGGWGGETVMVISGSVLLYVAGINWLNCGSQWQNLTYQQRAIAAGHELGHALGLSHHPVDGTGDMMYGSGATKNTPSVNNMQALINAYR